MPGTGEAFRDLWVWLEKAFALQLEGVTLPPRPFDNGELKDPVQVLQPPWTVPASSELTPFPPVRCEGYTQIAWLWREKHSWETQQ